MDHHKIRGDAVEVSVSLVRRLVASQFPQWAHLPVRPVEHGGWDNRTFRLGDEMSVRLPSAAGYAPQVEKEQRWLPRLALHLPLPIPTPLAMGDPGEGFPWSWSIYRWLDGEVSSPDRITDLDEFAIALARFLAALQAVDPTGGPAAGAHSFHRGRSLTVYDIETREEIVALGVEIDAVAAATAWEQAIAEPWRGAPVWVHGDVAPGNLLVKDGRLCAVIDFGCCAVGDPACDLAIAWTLLDAGSRVTFRSALPLDDATWARGRGWALWKALITLARSPERNGDGARAAGRTLDAVLADHAHSG